MTREWYAKGTAGHENHGQTAVYDETGRDIAIVYDGAAHAELIAAAPALADALRALLERAEYVATHIPVHNRCKGVSQAAHVAHMAGHLEQHAKIARAALAAAGITEDN